MYLRKWRLSAIAAVMMLLAVACGGSTSSTEPTEVVQLRWFVGLGTGDNVETQVPVQQAVVDRWNAANPNIQVTLEVVLRLNEQLILVVICFGTGNAQARFDFEHALYPWRSRPDDRVNCWLSRRRCHLCLRWQRYRRLSRGLYLFIRHSRAN